eukprot:7837224-Ditylum_brightwellii.AAC.1
MMQKMPMYGALLQRGHIYQEEEEKIIEFHIDTIIDEQFEDLHVYAENIEKAIVLDLTNHSFV